MLWNCKIIAFRRWCLLLGDKPRSYAIHSILKAVRVLRSFTRERPERAVTELSNELGWPKAVVHKILVTLDQGRIVQRDPHTRHYRLGPGIMELAGVFLSEEPLTREGTPLLKNLARRTGHTTALAVLDRLEVLYINVVEGSAALKTAAHVGDRRPAHATASGKVLLADLPPDILDQLLGRHMLPALTAKTIVDPERLREQLAQVVSAGYALNVEERIAGMAGVAAPVRDHHGKAVAALSVAIVRHLQPDQAIDEAIGQVMATANDLSRQLGALPEQLVREPTDRALPSLKG